MSRPSLAELRCLQNIRDFEAALAFFNEMDEPEDEPDVQVIRQPKPKSRPRKNLTFLVETGMSVSEIKALSRFIKGR